jgi:hypothetical protein
MLVFLDNINKRDIYETNKLLWCFMNKNCANQYKFGNLQTECNIILHDAIKIKEILNEL